MTGTRFRTASLTCLAASESHASRTGGRRDEVLGFADARRNMERVDPGVDQRIDELERFFKRHAAGKPVVGIVPVRDGEVVADRLADGPG